MCEINKKNMKMKHWKKGILKKFVKKRKNNLKRNFKNKKMKKFKK